MKSLLFGFFCLVHSYSFSQDFDYAIPGQRLAPILFEEVSYFTKSQVSTEDFKGKWLILDYWHIHCASCIIAMPKMDSIQNALKDKVQILLVGYTGRAFSPGQRKAEYEKVKNLYIKIREKAKVNLPIAYDSLSYHRLNADGAPFIVVIDPNGIVRTVTHSVTKEKLELLMRGGQPFFVKAKRKDEGVVTPTHSLLSLDGSSSQNITGSLISKYNNETRAFRSRPEGTLEARPTNVDSGNFHLTRIDLNDLYKIAYYGKERWDSQDPEYGLLADSIWLAVKDPSKFFGVIEGWKNYYSYSAILPTPVEYNDFLAKLRDDLSVAFPYVAEIIDSKIDCWQLVMDSAVIQPAAPEKNVKASNYNLKWLVERLRERGYDTRQDEPRFIIIDKTGLPDKFVITVETGMYTENFEDVLKIVNSNGLRLMKGQIVVKQLFIRDR